MRYSRQMYPAACCYAVSLIIVGILWDGPQQILPGIIKILDAPDLLISDYIEIAGAGAAFVNAGLVTLLSLVVLILSKTPPSGFTIVVMGLMSGFSFFGKNFVNILPILAGGWFYSACKEEPFSTNAAASLMASSLAPIVSYISSDGGYRSTLLSVAVGVLIGFVIPPLVAYTFKLQNGMNLYNMGFACGILGMILIPLMISSGKEIKTVRFWSTGNNLPIGLMVAALCTFLIITGFFFSGKPVWAIWAGYRRLLRTSGRAPSDYLRLFGGGTVLVNMGINGFAALGYILAIDGDLNGPTLGGILTIIGFSAFGKHLFNILPIIGGVVLGAIVMPWSISTPSIQIAGLFCTTLAPVAGYFGWQYGVLAGFLHSSVVLTTGSTLAGMNLYNNGFSGGLVAMVLYPAISALVRNRKPELLEEEYSDIFEGNKPITMTEEFLPEKKLEQYEKEDKANIR